MRFSRRYLREEALPTNPLKGGNAEGMTIDEIKAKWVGYHVDLDRQLNMGVKVEMEHTDYPEVAKRIALDHLVEIPDYYTRLNRMEDDAFAEWELEGDEDQED